MIDDERGQTVLDYAIGVGIFFVAVAFVVATIPGMFTPFVGTGDTQVADRVATSVATGTLGSPDEPYVLDRRCTVAFFDQLQDEDNPAPGDCRFDTSAKTVGEVFDLGVDESVQLRFEDADGDVATIDDTTLEAGAEPPDSTSVTITRRTVGIHGETYWLEVRAW
ncbi:MAG: DUF7287 family protein [Halanaeroarchaeum sp.]